MDEATLHKPFPITSVCRADLEDICTRQEIAKLSDAEMERIADKMADVYCSTDFWTDLEIIAKSVIEDKERAAKRAAR